MAYERDARAGGSPKYTLKKLSQLAFDGIFNFCTFPITMLTWMGIMCLFASLIYFSITILRKVIYHDVPTGFTALLFVIILFGGVQLISLGIIGEYVQRIFFQSKNRPLYIIDRRIADGAERSDH